MASVRKSLVLSFATRYSVGLIHFGSTMVLARLLTPEEIGVFAVGAAIVALAHTLRDFGVANYLIQERELTELRVRTAFGATLMMAWGLALILFLLSDSIAAFYDRPGVREVILVLAVTFVLIPFSSVALALLRRDMNFGAIYRVNTSGAIANVTTAITLAALGIGFMSLAWGALAGAVTTVLVTALHRPEAARLIPSFREMKRVFSFGAQMSAASLLGEIGDSSAGIVLGRTLGFDAVGFFSRGLGLIKIFRRLFVQAVTPVVLPAFAKHNRSQGDLKGPYVKMIAYTTVLGWPFYLFLSLWALSIIRLLYGDQWDPAAPVARILCIFGALSLLSTFAMQVLASLGAARQVLLTQATVVPIRLVLTIAAALHSLMAVAVVHVVVSLLYLAVTYRYLNRFIDLSVRDMVDSVLKSTAVTLLSCAIPATLALASLSEPGIPWIHFALAVICAPLGWIVAVFLLKHPVQDEIKCASQKLLEHAPSRWKFLQAMVAQASKSEGK